MSSVKNISLLYPDNPDGSKPLYRRISDESAHNLGLDRIVPALSTVEAERAFIMRVLTNMTDSAYVAEYRTQVFEDILRHPDLRDRMMKILEKINFLRDYGTFKRDYEESASMFELMHRLEEIRDYITCVEAIHECLSDREITSEGLIRLREYADSLYHDNAFAELKKDIEEVKASTTDLKSVTLGVNLNARFEAESIGVISINNRHFTKSGVIGTFSDAITARSGGVQDGNDWNGGMHYQPFNATASEIEQTVMRMGALKIASGSALGFLTMASLPQGDHTTDITRYMDRIVNHMLYLTFRKLRSVLNKYVNITITTITDLMPEFVYYIRLAEYVEKMRDAGYKLRRPTVKEKSAGTVLPDLSGKPVGKSQGTVLLDLSGESPESGLSGSSVATAKPSSHDYPSMSAVSIYNLLLAQSHMGADDRIDIVTNDLIFDREHSAYILTGANRGGKTTITIAVGLLFVLAQGGCYIPGSSFEYTPVDCIFTHFPADEDKTMDLGRLGEECKRFKELFSSASGKSLILLNETFSTTSFEEGYYIARDAVRAILKKGCRTIYNTHMHKLAREIDEINLSVQDEPFETPGKCCSLIVRSDGGERSFKIAVAPPEGMSYAEDIARKYGVTYDMLLEE